MNAILVDATFIYFDCGRSVRIGIRHRFSQTLFISHHIETDSLDGPPFGSICAGLYIAMGHDMVQRHEEIVKQRAKSKKRRQAERDAKGEEQGAQKRAKKGINEDDTRRETACIGGLSRPDQEPMKVLDLKVG